MPWQQFVADVALEVDPATGQLAYRELRLTVPRQSGKTTLLLAKAAHRCSATGFFGARQTVVYTAQTRKDAKRKFKEDYEGDLLAAPRLKVKPCWPPGDEHFRFPNRSRFGIESTTEKAGHGSTIDEAYIDEAFAHADNRVEQSFNPAMITRRNKQTVVISTAGWLDGSPYLWGKVESGRQLVAEGVSSRVAYFEWSADQDADPFDRAVWRSCMPALGFTVTEDDIAAELETMLTDPEQGLNGFRRAYLNQWVPKFAQHSVFPAGAWEFCAVEGSQIVGTPVLAVSVTPDRSTVTVAAAGRAEDGRWHVEIIRHGSLEADFTPWITDLAAISRRQHAKIVLCPTHPAGALLPELEKARVPLVKVTQGDYIRGCGLVFDLVSTGKLSYPPPQPELDAAIAAASRKQSGETWRWAGDGISPLVAASQAVWVATTQPAGGKGRVIALA